MNKKLTDAQDVATHHLETLVKEVNCLLQNYNVDRKICIYACGSLGRLEMVRLSDLDLFFVSGIDDDKEIISRVDEISVFFGLIEINRKLNYAPISKNGEYLAFINQEKILEIGSREEDYNNSLTARMLLLLESKPVFNVEGYGKLIDRTLDKYFTDFVDNNAEYYPLFLMNDILRYWYILTINYERRRDKGDTISKKCWRRLKLKYARLVTCYSLIACLYEPNVDKAKVKEFVLLTPFQRLDYIANKYINTREIVGQIQDEYAWFLELKNQEEPWWDVSNNKTTAFEHAARFHDLIHDFMSIVSQINPSLKSKTDNY